MAVSMFKEPVVTAFVECPNCARRLPFDAELERCPDCREPIELEYLLISAAINELLAQACAIAAAIKRSDVAVLLVAGVSVLLYFSAGTYPIAPPLPIERGFFAFYTLLSGVTVVAVCRWFRRFGGLGLLDEGYQSARRDMRDSLRLWVALLATQVIALATWNL